MDIEKLTERIRDLFWVEIKDNLLILAQEDLKWA